jgi:hypothetical protein
MDERDIVRSMITHIDDAKKEVEKLSKSKVSQNCKAELHLAYQSLNDSISHCHGIFGPSTLQK